MSEEAERVTVEQWRRLRRNQALRFGGPIPRTSGSQTGLDSMDSLRETLPTTPSQASTSTSSVPGGSGPLSYLAAPFRPRPLGRAAAEFNKFPSFHAPSNSETRSPPASTENKRPQNGSFQRMLPTPPTRHAFQSIGWNNAVTTETESPLPNTASGHVHHFSPPSMQPIRPTANSSIHDEGGLRGEVESRHQFNNDGRPIKSSLGRSPIPPRRQYHDYAGPSRNEIQPQLRNENASVVSPLAMHPTGPGHPFPNHASHPQQGRIHRQPSNGNTPITSPLSMHPVQPAHRPYIPGAQPPRGNTERQFGNEAYRRVPPSSWNGPSYHDGFPGHGRESLRQQNEHQPTTVHGSPQSASQDVRNEVSGRTEPGRSGGPSPITVPGPITVPAGPAGQIALGDAFWQQVQEVIPRRFTGNPDFMHQLGAQAAMYALRHGSDPHPADDPHQTDVGFDDTDDAPAEEDEHPPPIVPERHFGAGHPFPSLFDSSGRDRSLEYGSIRDYRAEILRLTNIRASSTDSQSSGDNKRTMGPKGNRNRRLHCRERHADRRSLLVECPICKEKMCDSWTSLVWCKRECGQNFHKECFKQWERVLRSRREQIWCPYWYVMLPFSQCTNLR